MLLCSASSSQRWSVVNMRFSAPCQGRKSNLESPKIMESWQLQKWVFLLTRVTTARRTHISDPERKLIASRFHRMRAFSSTGSESTRVLRAECRTDVPPRIQQQQLYQHRHGLLSDGSFRQKRRNIFLSDGCRMVETPSDRME